MKADKESTKGITSDRGCWCDIYCGTQEALITAGLAKLEWFPTAPGPAKTGPRRHIKRSFEISLPLEQRRKSLQTGDELMIRLIDRRNGKWQIYIPVSIDEEKRRSDEYAREREREAEERGREQRRELDREEAAHLAHLPALIRSLPPFVPGSMSEAEMHHMRIVRGLGEYQRNTLMVFAERLLGHAATQSTRRSIKLPSLQLVVDNDHPPVQ